VSIKEFVIDFRKKLPTEVAKEYQAVKSQTKSLVKAGEILNVSPATVSRYIALLDLPKEIQERVDRGELPVSNPLRALRKKDGKKKSPKTFMKEIEGDLLEALRHYRYLTLIQASTYLNKNIKLITAGFEALKSLGLVNIGSEYSPYYYELTPRAFALFDMKIPKRYTSANAIHQHLMRNKIEIEMQAVEPSAKFVQRKSCIEKGLYPAVGEHFLFFKRKGVGEGEFSLVLIDDYLMASNRIYHALTRIHFKEKTSRSENHKLMWTDFIQTMFIYTTNPQQKKNFERFISKHHKTLPLADIYVRETSPIWRIL